LNTDASSAATALTFWTYNGSGSASGVQERARIDPSGNFLLAGDTQFYGINPYTHKKFMQFAYPLSGFGAYNDQTRFFTPGEGSGVAQMAVTHGGNVGARGSFSGGQTFADYAEYFEWADGNPNNEDRIGVTVVLDEGKIRPSSEADPAHSIIGVVSGTAGVVLGSAPFEWSGKYEKDDFGRIKTYEEVWLFWSSEEGHHNHKEGEVPEDVVVPEDAERRVYTKMVVSSSYDEAAPYESRDHRPEWACIGLVGQVHVKKGQAVGDRWIKMKAVSDNAELWMIRCAA
jgi:hypothetical protein